MYRFFIFSGFKFIIPHDVGVALICLATWLTYKNQVMPVASMVEYLYLFFRFVEATSKFTKHSSNFLLHWPQLNKIMNWYNKKQLKSEPIIISSIQTNVEDLQVKFLVIFH